MIKRCRWFKKQTSWCTGWFVPPVGSHVSSWFKPFNSAWKNNTSGTFKVVFYSNVLLKTKISLKAIRCLNIFLIQRIYCKFMTSCPRLSLLSEWNEELDLCLSPVWIVCFSWCLLRKCEFCCDTWILNLCKYKNIFILVCIFLFLVINCFYFYIFLYHVQCGFRRKQLNVC